MPDTESDYGYSGQKGPYYPPTPYGVLPLCPYKVLHKKYSLERKLATRLERSDWTDWVCQEPTTDGPAAVSHRDLFFSLSKRSYYRVLRMYSVVLRIKYSINDTLVFILDFYSMFFVLVQILVLRACNQHTRYSYLVRNVKLTLE